MNKEECIEKAESLLAQAEEAFDLTQDGLTNPADYDKLWQRGSYSSSLANSYIALAQVKNIDNMSDTLGDIVNMESKG